MGEPGRPVFEVLAPGPLSTFQDRGRPGFAHFGVPTSGAADRGSYELANRLVGNRAGATALEVTLGGLTLRTVAACTVAVTGADVLVAAGARTASLNSVAQLAPGDLLRLDPPRSGLRSYLAVRHGFLAEAVFGSQSTDVLSGLGPAPLRAGDVVYRSDRPALPYPGVDLAPTASPPSPLRVRALWGPRSDWLTVESRRRFADSVYAVTAQTNRIGARLDGPRLSRTITGELPSEGIVAGAVQVPPDGSPLIFLADHPTTGGYPVVAVVHPRDLDLVAQLRPGDSIGFRISWP
jgi:biotin-dependent carboxylase-like uncharacterized protein